MSSLPFISTAKNITVNSGENKVLHSFPLSNFNSMEYFVGVKKQDLTKNRSFKLLVSKLASGLSDTISSIIGTDMNYSIDVQVNGVNAEVILQNNEAYTLQIGFIYIKI